MKTNSTSWLPAYIRNSDIRPPEGRPERIKEALLRWFNVGGKYDQDIVIEDDAAVYSDTVRGGYWVRAAVFVPTTETF